uniref:UDP-glucuronosyltransferase n=1 Tax=Haemonchus contortus TaxID=6289 RepID=A0A7I4YRK0_HAECO
MISSWVIFLVLSLHSIDVNAYKFLVYSPIFGYSHTNFMGAIADTLTEAGHDVTVLMPIMDKDEAHKTGVKLTKKIIEIPPDPRVEEWMKQKSILLSQMWTMQPSVFSLMQMAQNMTASFAAQCEALVSNDALMKQLAAEKFDVGIAEAFSICGLGIFEVLKIPSSIATFSGVYMSIISQSIGEPVVPSYVPGGMATKGDRMNILDRLMNVADTVLGNKFFGNTFDEEIKVFRAKYGQQFRDYEEIIADASYVLTNANPYLDYPRPTLHKTVSLGGIAVHIDLKKNVLSKKWDSILNERNTTVFVSFGSVAKSIYMPDEYKKNLLKVFESMPETTFIWKYEEEDSKLAAHLKNVHLSTWAPQNALLADPRLTVFITHGGLGSTTELAYLGKPAILMPVFADQTRNAHMLAKHGGGIVLTKFALEDPKILRDTLEKIFNDASYSRNAKRLSEMLLNQPISAEQLLIKHCEFAAKFGRLPNLDPYSRHLSFIEYFLIDIFVVVAGALILVAYVAYRIAKRCFTAKAKSKIE